MVLHPLAPRRTFLDLEFQGQPHVIATAVIETSSGVVLIDPGPSSTLPVLRSTLRRAGVSPEDVRWILATHIHLDHAGASGLLVRELPKVQVVVHPRGAPHLADPTRLLASARRLYGDQMDRLWGDVSAVPKDRLRTVEGETRLSLGDVTLDVAYTPGHAIHHVSYFDAASGIAFTGDTAGMRINGTPYVFPPTPPPDINLEEWEQSLERILQWQPERVFPTHFGPVRDVALHVALLRDRLRHWATWVSDSLASSATDDETARAFARAVGADARRCLGAEEAAHFELGAAPQLCWYGLARYWRTRKA